jgi:CRP/FNR family cyclic AMP-dependent transcriptional regulator
MLTGEVVGWMAAGLTLLTFSMRSMIGLRSAALAANMCFIAYGSLSGLYPVLVLHVLLVPCNLYRLIELLRDRHHGKRQPMIHT